MTRCGDWLGKRMEDVVYATEHGGSGTGLEGRGLPSLTELDAVGKRVKPE